MNSLPFSQGFHAPWPVPKPRDRTFQGRCTIQLPFKDHKGMEGTGLLG